MLCDNRKHWIMFLKLYFGNNLHLILSNTSVPRVCRCQEMNIQESVLGLNVARQTNMNLRVWRYRSEFPSELAYMEGFQADWLTHATLDLLSSYSKVHIGLSAAQRLPLRHWHVPKAENSVRLHSKIASTALWRPATGVAPADNRRHSAVEANMNFRVRR